MLVGQAPLVYRDPAIADIVHVDMTGKQAVEFGDHERGSVGKGALSA